jgi:hypothetical protein
MSDLELWNQRSAEFLCLSPFEQDLYIFATQNGFDPTEFFLQGIHLEEALDIFLETSGIFFTC